MLIKYAIAKIDTVFPSYKDFNRFVKTAGLSDKTQNKILTKIASIPAIKADPDNFIYLRNRSISAFETWGFNQNYDGFPSKELQEKHKTFIQCPVDVDHINEDPERDVIGIVLDSTYIPKQLVVTGMAGGVEQIFPFSEELKDDMLAKGFKCKAIGDWVENLLAIDKKKAEKHTPGLPDAILTGEVSDTSMGTGVLKSECSVCGNIAEDENQFCDHIMYGKGKQFMHQGKMKLAGEINHGLGFFEDSVILSEVFAKKANKKAEAGGEGADFNAKILQVVAGKQRKPDGSILDYVKVANLPGYYVNQNNYLEVGEEPGDVKAEREKYEKDLQKFYDKKKDVKVGDKSLSFGFLRQAFVQDFDEFKNKFEVKSKADEIRLKMAHNKIATTEDVIGIIQALVKKNNKIDKEFINNKLESLGYHRPEIEDALSYLNNFKGMNLFKQSYFAEDISVSQQKNVYDQSMKDDKKNATEQIGSQALDSSQPGSLQQNIYSVLKILGKTQQEKGGDSESKEHENTYNKLKADASDGSFDTTLNDFGQMIAKDHLDEFDNYYKYLPKFENELKQKDAKKLDVAEQSKDKKPKDDMVKYSEPQEENESWSQRLQAHFKKTFKNYWKDEQLTGQESKNQGIGLESYDNVLNKKEFDYKKKNGDPKDYGDHKDRKGEFKTDEFGKPISKKAGFNKDAIMSYKEFLTQYYFNYSNERIEDLSELALDHLIKGQEYLNSTSEEDPQKLNVALESMDKRFNGFDGESALADYDRYVASTFPGSSFDIKNDKKGSKHEGIKENYLYYKFSSDGSTVTIWVKPANKEVTVFTRTSATAQRFVQKYRDLGWKVEEIRDQSELGKMAGKSNLAKDDEHSGMKNSDTVGGSNSTYKIPSGKDEKEHLAEYPLSGAVAKLLNILSISNKDLHIYDQGAVFNKAIWEEFIEAAKESNFDENEVAMVVASYIDGNEDDQLPYTIAHDVIEDAKPKKKAHVNPDADSLMEERLEEKKKYKFENADTLKRTEHTKGNIENLKIALKKLADYGDSLPMPEEIDDSRPEYNPDYRYYDRKKGKNKENFTLEELKYLSDHSLFGTDIDLDKAIRGLGKDYEVTLYFDKEHKEGTIETAPQSSGYKQLVKEKGKKNVLEEDLIAQYHMDVEDMVGGKQFSDENNKPITKVPRLTFWDFPISDKDYFDLEEKIDSDIEYDAGIEEKPINKHEDVDLSETDLGYDKELIEDYVTELFGEGQSRASIYNTIKQKLPQVDINLIQTTVFNLYDKLKGEKASREKPKFEEGKEGVLKALADVTFNDMNQGANVKLYKKDSAGNPTSEQVDQGTVSTVAPQQGKDNKTYTDVNVNGKNYSTEDFVAIKQSKLADKKATLDKLESIVFDVPDLNKKGSLDKLESLFNDKQFKINISAKKSLDALDSLFDQPLQLKQLQPKVASFEGLDEGGFKLNGSPMSKGQVDPLSLINEDFFNY